MRTDVPESVPACVLNGASDPCSAYLANINVVYPVAYCVPPVSVCPFPFLSRFGMVSGSAEVASHAERHAELS